MKKLIAILALMAAGSAYAADVDFVSVDKADGTAEVTWTATGCTVLGMGLEVAVDSADSLTDVDVDSFNVFIDQAFDIVDGGGTLTEPLPTSNAKASVGAAGSVAAFDADFALCAGYLAENNTGLASGKITFTADADSSVTLTENATRGGVVGIKDGAVAPLTTNLGAGLVVDITAASSCHFTEGDANCDDSVDFGDIQTVLNNWGMTDTASLAAADVNGDSSVDFGDIQTVLNNWGMSW